MKTIREHFEDLPEPFRTQALNQSSRLDGVIQEPATALELGLAWGQSSEGYYYWSGIYHMLEGANPRRYQYPSFPSFNEAQHLYKQVSAESGQPEEASQQQTTTTVQYSDQPVANPTLVFGTDVSTMSADETIRAIKANNAQIKTFEETGISSAYITERVNGIKAANEVLVKHLDSFVSAPAAQPATA